MYSLQLSNDTVRQQVPLCFPALPGDLAGWSMSVLAFQAVGFGSG